MQAKTLPDQVIHTTSPDSWVSGKETTKKDISYKLKPQHNLVSSSKLVQKEIDDPVFIDEKPQADISDFFNHYVLTREALQDIGFSLSFPLKEKPFENQLCITNDISEEVADIWINAYLDYMILVGWLIHTKQTQELYPPFAIQQVLRLHRVYNRSYEYLCELITPNEEIISFVPFKLLAKPFIDEYNNAQKGYLWARLFLKQNIYENHQAYCIKGFNPQVENVWEEFKTTLMKSEFHFNFLTPDDKKAFDFLLSQNIDQNALLSSEPKEILRVQKSLRTLMEIGELERKWKNIAPKLVDKISPSFKITDMHKVFIDRIDQMSFKPEFVNMLAFEQRISIQEAITWIVEYKKFLFLMLENNDQRDLYPSRRIREVWHLHMYFVEDYLRDVLSLRQINYPLYQLEIQENEDNTDLYEGTLKNIKLLSKEWNKKLWPARGNDNFERISGYSTMRYSCSYSLHMIRRLSKNDQKFLTQYQNHIKKSYPSNHVKQAKGRHHNDPLDFYYDFPGAQTSNSTLPTSLTNTNLQSKPSLSTLADPQSKQIVTKNYSKPALSTTTTKTTTTTTRKSHDTNIKYKNQGNSWFLKTETGNTSHRARSSYRDKADYYEPIHYRSLEPAPRYHPRPYNRNSYYYDDYGGGEGYRGRSIGTVVRDAAIYGAVGYGVKKLLGGLFG